MKRSGNGSGIRSKPKEDPDADSDPLGAGGPTIRREVTLDDGPPLPVHVLYLRPPEPEFVALDTQVNELTARFPGTVRLSVIDADELPPSLAAYAGRRAPTLLVLRGGRLIGEAVGAPPLRELISLLECAVAWPHHDDGAVATPA